MSGCFAHGDLDEDGDEDFLTITGGNIQYHEHTGGGTFVQNTPNQELEAVEVIDLADLDLDGDLDLISLKEGFFGAYLPIWYENTGGGSFGEQQELPAEGYFPVLPRIGDFDGDEIPDMVVAGSPGIQIAYGNGDGTFGPVAEIAELSLPTGLALADMDWDGDLDVVACNFHAIYWYENTDGAGTYSFTDFSAHPESWRWDFGDGSTSTEQNPVHTYAAPGEYTVCLAVENIFGTDTLCQELQYVLPPSTDFTYEVEALAVQFTDQSGNQPDSWLWDFDDGTGSTAQNPSHEYAVPGLYTVCLTAANAAGEQTYCEEVETLLNASRTLRWDNRLRVFPNPVSDQLNLVFDQQPTPGTELWISNMLGQQLQRLPQMESSRQLFSVEHLAEGTYLLEVVQQGHQMARVFFVVAR